MDQIDKFKQLVENSDRVLITSHISPDPDAICSLLLLGLTLKKNYPDKQVTMLMQDKPEGLTELSGFSEIKFAPLLDELKASTPDLLILLDGNNYDRFARLDGATVRKFVEDNQKLKTAIIDHHEPIGKDEADVFINQGSISVAQDVYEICFDHLKLERPEGYGELTMMGIYSDSGGFAYQNRRHRETFKIVSDLIDAGVSVEKVRNYLSKYSDDNLKVLAELANNVTHQDSYNYSFVGDKFTEDWFAAGKTQESIHATVGLFVDRYIRNIGNRQWGFVIYPNRLLGEDWYSISFRAVSGTMNVAELAKKLGGGGHIPAAGAKIEAKSVKEAIQKVQQAITST